MRRALSGLYSSCPTCVHRPLPSVTTSSRWCWSLVAGERGLARHLAVKTTAVYPFGSTDSLTHFYQLAKISRPPPPSTSRRKATVPRCFDDQRRANLDRPGSDPSPSLKPAPRRCYHAPAGTVSRGDLVADRSWAEEASRARSVRSNRMLHSHARVLDAEASAESDGDSSSIAPFEAGAEDGDESKLGLNDYGGGSDDGEGAIDPETARWVVNPDLDPYIRSNLAHNSLFSPPTRGSEDPKHDTRLSVVLLGTGAGVPTLLHGNPAVAVRMGSTTYLFDAGEGVQMQLMKSRLRRGDLKKIFITHLHADHVLGLPGLILSLQLVAKARSNAPSKMNRRRQGAASATGSASLPVLQIYGPEGLYEYLATVLRLTHTELNFLRVEVHELTGASDLGGFRNGPFPLDSGRSRLLSFRARRPAPSLNLPPSLRRNLIRKEIPRSDNGTWTLETPIEYTKPEQAAALSRIPGGVAGRGVYVTAAEVHHLPKLTCFGYVVQEPRTQPRAIDVIRAKAAGVKPGRKYNQLKFGFPVESDADPSVVVQPEHVLVGPPKPSRSVAILGDCCAVPGPMSNLCHHVDVLVHEATLSEEEEAKVGIGSSAASLGPSNKSIFGGHSTAAMAGSLARRVQPKVLLLNHISPTTRVRHAELALMREAERQLESVDDINRPVNDSLFLSMFQRSLSSSLSFQASAPVSEAPSGTKPRVQVGYDHLEVFLPIDGFPW